MDAKYFGFLNEITDDDVQETWNRRKAVHKKMIRAVNASDAVALAGLALGMDDEAGSYSAAEHGLGPKVLAASRSAPQQILDLAFGLLEAEAGRVPHLIWEANLPYFKVGVGSELACLMRPKRHWVCNSRTLWTRLFSKWASAAKAEEELRLYQDNEASSAMYWPKWRALYDEVGPFMERLWGAVAYAPHLTRPEKLDYLWADAVCNAVYVTIRGR